jgi:hypothetical protein
MHINIFLLQKLEPILSNRFLKKMERFINKNNLGYQFYVGPHTFMYLRSENESCIEET